MEFTGRIKKILPMRTGTSARTGNDWKSLPFIFEYFEEDNKRFADSVVLETFDTKVIDNLKEGMEVRVGFGHRTREYEGKHYNELRLYKIECVSTQQQPQAANQPTGGANAAAAGSNADASPTAPQGQQNQAQEEQHDDLPF